MPDNSSDDQNHRLGEYGSGTGPEDASSTPTDADSGDDSVLTALDAVPRLNWYQIDVDELRDLKILRAVLDPIATHPDRNAMASLDQIRSPTQSTPKDTDTGVLAAISRLASGASEDLVSTIEASETEAETETTPDSDASTAGPIAADVVEARVEQALQLPPHVRIPVVPLEELQYTSFS